MNCRNLEPIITELARNQILEVRVREDALSHLEMCKPCSARLADERALSAGLRTVAGNGTEIGAAARIEAALVARFRERRSVDVGGTGSPTRSAVPKWSPWSIAAAATILIVSAFALLEFVVMRKGNSLQPTTIAGSVNAIPVPTSPDEASPAATDDRTSAGVQMPDPPEISSRASDRRRGAFRDAGLRGVHRPLISGFGRPAGAEEEITTEFVPLTTGSNLSQSDELQMVRLELPRSVLQSFGLPMNVDRAGQRVKADVLLGHDGVARAIRFVK